MTLMVGPHRPDDDRQLMVAEMVIDDDGNNTDNTDGNVGVRGRFWGPGIIHLGCVGRGGQQTGAITQAPLAPPPPRRNTRPVRLQRCSPAFAALFGGDRSVRA